MPFEFRPAKRSNVHLLLAIAGPTGSGKTKSALELAKGICGDARFAVVDTENGRASMYADSYNFDVVELEPPFSSERYLEAIVTAEKAGYPLVVVDSGSHEYESEGGILDRHQSALDEFLRRARLKNDQREDWQIDDANNMRAWKEAKGAHKAFKLKLIQMRMHVIMCLRAEKKIEVAKETDPDNPKRQKTVIKDKKTLTSLDGWVTLCEKNLPFEMTTMLLVLPDQPGVPKFMKKHESIVPLIPLDKPLSVETGRRLAEWSKGEPSAPAGAGAADQSSTKKTIEPDAAKAGGPAYVEIIGIQTSHKFIARFKEELCEALRPRAGNILNVWLLKQYGITGVEFVPSSRFKEIGAAAVDHARDLSIAHEESAAKKDQ